MGQIDFNKLWQNFLDTITNHYMDFRGRVGRAQFWYFILICVLVTLAGAIIDSILRTGLLVAVIGLALLLPTGGMAARRVQDSGNNGSLVWIWVIASGINRLIGLMLALSGPFGAVGFLYFFFSIGWLISLVELVAVIALIYFCVQPGTPGDNAYGPPPPVWTPGPA